VEDITMLKQFIENSNADREDKKILVDGVFLALQGAPQSDYAKLIKKTAEERANEN